MDATPPAAATIDAAAAAAAATKQRVAQVIHCVPLQPKRRRRLLVVVLRLGKAAEYGDEHVCVSVCQSLSAVNCGKLCLVNCASDLYQTFYACYLSPWLGPPLAALRWVMYFRFCR